MVQITVLNKTGSVQQILNSKEAGVNQLAQLTGSKIKIGHSEVVKVEVNPDQVAKIERVANDAVITLKNGEQITLEGFFDAADNRLVLQEGEKAWQVEGLQQAPAGELAISYLPVDTAPGLAITESGGVSDSLLAWGAGLLGVGAIAGIAANSGGSGGGSPAPADTTPPVAGKLGLKGFDDTGSSATDHLSRDNSFKLQLAGQEAGTTVKYQLSTDGGKTWKDSTLDQSALADGVYQFRAVVTDKAGNTAISNVETVTVDRQTTAGSLSLSSYNDTGVSTTDHISRDQNFKLLLTGQEAGSTVQYQLSSDGGKTWVDSTRDQSALADGVYQFRAVVTDKAGNTAISNVETVTVDRQTTAGSLSLTSYNDTGVSATDHISRDQNFKLKLAGQEAGSTVQYQLSTDGGKTWVDSTRDQSALADGVYQFRAVVTDKTGNTATSNVETVTVDRQATAGSLSLTSYNDTGVSTTDHISRDQNFKLQLSGREAGSTVQYQLSTDGGKTWVDSTRDQSALADGTYQFRAVVTDKAGNTAVSNVETVTVDRTLDTSTIQLVIDGVTADNTLDLVEAQQTQLISGSLKNLPADIENYQLSLLVGGQSYALTVDATTGQWSAQVPGSVLWQAENIQASLQLTDKAGNQTVLNIDKAYTLNPVPEAPTQLQATIDTFTDIIVTGTAFAGSEIKVKDAAGNVLASGTAKADGSFELFFNNGFVDGQKVNVTATVNGHESVIAQSELVSVPLMFVSSINQDGYLQGYAELGSVISVYDADHQLIKTLTLQPDSIFTGLDIFTISLEPLAEGTQLFVVASKNGVEGRTESVTVDFTPPAAATNLSFNELGQLTGQAEANSFIQVLDKNNNYVGSGRTDDQGYFVATSDTYRPNNYAFNNGELLKVMVTDHNRNTSDISEIQAPDFLVAAQVRSIGKDGTVSGMAEAGSSIIIKDATGKVIASTDSQPDGRFTVKLPDVLKNGQEITVSASNSKGQTSSDSTVVVDFKAPAAPHDLVFNADGSLLIGKAEAFSTVNVSVNDRSLYVYSKVDANGNFTIQLDTPLHDGQKLTISVTDRNANQSKAVEITAPDYALTPVISGEIGINGQLHGFMGEPDATIIVKDADGKQLELKDISISPWGNAFTATVASPLTHGQQVSVSVVDARGHESKAVTVLVDLKAPKTVSEAVIADDGQTIRGHAEANAAIQVLDKQGLVVGRGYVNAEGEFNFKLFSFFLKGETLKVQVIDAAGNGSKLKSITAPVDDTAPDKAQDLVIDQYGRTLTGTAEANSTVTIFNKNNQVASTLAVGADGKFSAELWDIYLRGETLSVKVTDRAGNVSQIATVVAPVDTASPEQPVELVMGITGRLLSGKAEPYSIITVKNEQGQAIGSAEANAQGEFKVSLYETFLKGQTLLVSVSDAAGNSSKPLSFVTPIDTVAPVAPSAVVIDKSGVYITGQAEALSRIFIYDDQKQLIANGSANSDGRFAFTLDDYYLQGQQLQVVSVDAAGNSSQPVIVTAPVDNVAPEAARNLVFSNNLTLTGQAEQGAVVQVKTLDGKVLGETSVWSENSFQISGTALSRYQQQDVLLVVVDNAGNTSKPVKITVPVNPDAPAAPDKLAFNADGTVLTGIATPDLFIAVYDAKGNEVSGFDRVNSDGSFSVNLWDAHLQGEKFFVYAYEFNGAYSVGAPVSAPLDNIAPDAPEISSISDVLRMIVGTAENGSTVLVKDADGTLLASEPVYEDGRFTFVLDHLFQGQNIEITAVDKAGNISKKIAHEVGINPYAPDAPHDIQLAANGYSLGGKAALYTTIIVYDQLGRHVSSGKTDAEGNFSVDFNTPFLKGEVLQVVATQENYESVPVRIIAPVDVTAPSSATDVQMAQNGHTITGSAEADSVIEVFDSQNYLIGSGRTNAEGAFDFNLNNFYGKGEVLTVVVKDNSGNRSEAVNVVAPVDTVAPAQPMHVTVDYNSKYIYGVAEPGAQVSIKDASGKVLADFSTHPLTGLFEESIWGFDSTQKDIYLTVRDAAGNASKPLYYRFEPDTTAPAAVTNLHIDAATYIITGNAEPLSDVEIQFGRKWNTEIVQVAADGTFVLHSRFIPQAGDQMDVTVIDRSGNRSETKKLIVPADLVAPATPTDISVSEDGRSLSGTADAESTVFVTIGNEVHNYQAYVGNDGHFTVYFDYYSYVKGELLTVVAKDKAGNVSEATTVHAPVDSTAPQAASRLHFNESGSQLIGFGEAKAEFTVKDVTGKELAKGIISDEGVFTVSFNTHFLKGEKLFVSLADAAGNKSKQVSVIAPVDDVPPAAPYDVQFTLKSSTLTGKAEFGDRVLLKDEAGHIVATVYVPESGSFTSGVSSFLLRGQTIKVVTTDLAGNESDAVSIDIPLDSKAPSSVTDLQLSSDGRYLTGKADAKSLITVYEGAALGQPDYIRAVADAKGNFKVDLQAYKLHGEVLSVYAYNKGSHFSKAVSIVAPLDDIAPDVPQDIVVSGGYSQAAGYYDYKLTGVVEANSTVTLTDADGSLISGLQTDATGKFSSSFNSLYDSGALPGTKVSLVVTDLAGNQSKVLQVSLPVDTTPPDQPTALSVYYESWSEQIVITGNAEWGVTLVARRADGREITQDTMYGDQFRLELNLDSIKYGEKIFVVAIDHDGNESTAATITPSDTLSTPEVSSLTFAVDGKSLSGEVISSSNPLDVVARDSNGKLLATVSTEPDGAFILVFDKPLQHGEQVFVSASDYYSPIIRPDTIITAPVIGTEDALIAPEQAVADSAAATDIHSVLEQADNQQASVAVGTADSDVVNTGLLAQLLTENGSSSVTGLINSAIATQPQDAGQQGVSVDALTAIHITAPAALVANTLDVASLLHTQQLLV